MLGRQGDGSVVFSEEDNRTVPLSSGRDDPARLCPERQSQRD